MDACTGCCIKNILKQTLMKPKGLEEGDNSFVAPTDFSIPC